MKPQSEKNIKRATFEKHCLKKSKAKEIGIIALLFSKRLFKRPLFLAVLILMPASVLLLSGIQSKDDAVVRIALYCGFGSNTSPQRGGVFDGDLGDSIPAAPQRYKLNALPAYSGNADTPAYPTADNAISSASLINELLELSNSAVTFYTCETEAELREDVRSGRASCGYLLPENMQDSIAQYARKHTAFIRAVRGKDELSTRMVDEILLSHLYRPLAFQMLTDYLTGKTEQPIDTLRLAESFESHSSNELLFSFEYADGSKNSLLNDKNANYMMLPIRGIVSVLILLACMSGALLWYGDRENKLLPLLNKSKRRYCQWLALILPCLYAGAAGVITIKITGSAESLTTELSVMLVYLFACVGMVRLLSCVFFRREIFLASIPVLMIASLLLCPVFINVETFLPPLGWAGRLLPTYHYLHAIHDAGELAVLALLGIIYIVAGQFLGWILVFLTKVRQQYKYT